MLPTMRANLLVLLCFAAPALAQRPKSAAEAIERFEQQRDRTEAERQRAAGDLGDFADAAVTALLLAELQRAEGFGYRQTIVKALGERPREGVVEPLAKLLAASTAARASENLAAALCKQGEAGIDELAKQLAADAGPRRNAICDALSRSDQELARRTLFAELQRAQNRDRLPPLRALRSAAAAEVDAVRLALVKDGDPLIAATALLQLGEHGHAEAPALALEVSRRKPNDAAGDIATAVAAGLLVAPSTPEHYEALLVAAAFAEDPFRKQLQPRWAAAIASPPLREWFAKAAPQRKLARERAIAAEVLGLTAGDARPAAAEVLAKLLLDKESMVVHAAATALASLGREQGEAPLAAALRSASELQIAPVLAALQRVRSDAPESQVELLREARGKTAAGRAAAMQLLAAKPPADSASALAIAGENLAHKAWPVRSAAMDLLRALRVPAAVPMLFGRLDAEGGRLHQDLIDALRDLTALQFSTAAAWQDWWQKEGERFRVVDKPKPADRPRRGRGERDGREPAGAKATVSYWDLPVHSERVVFVVDTSGSMAQPFGTGDALRLDEAKQQLTRVLGLLPRTAKANIIAFGGEARALGTRIEPLTAARQQAAATFAQGLVAKGPTNVHDALWLAFADAEVDTIFLLTDGYPSAGPVVDAKALLAAVARWNLGRCLRVHTVALGGRSDLLAELADATGGNHAVAR
jgi:hypothetical protein